jgi:glutamine cyclotransferase
MKIVIIGAVALIILAIAWYALSPLLSNKKVDEKIPVQNTQTTTSEDTKLSNSVSIVPTTGHPASGQVRIVESDGKKFIRYENYKTINGPDIQIWLAKDLKGSAYINLGPLKATEGNINYEVPAGTKIEDYRYVLTWCEDFSVLFNSADLSMIKR